MADWVLAAERAYVAAATAPGSPTGAVETASEGVGEPSTTASAAAFSALRTALTAFHLPGPASVAAYAFAAAGAVSSRYLAVGTPRSFGVIVDGGTVDALALAIADAGSAPGAAVVAGAALALTAHRTWFAPRDIRCATATGPGDAAAHLAACVSGRVTSLDEALACDIVSVHTRDLVITARHIRRGTHLIVATAALVDPDLRALAAVTRDADLPALAAGFVDGRQLDEITIFIAG
ncbi:MAG TPA: hypothetical protein VFP84_25415 [Kofleriaceae bacterium]|nr:hypothetical protein [Kofleriaceae bacterium]